MAYITRTRQVLLNPAERCRKYEIEVRHKRAITNDGHRKYDKNGKPIRLNKEELAWRSGFLAHAKMSQRAYMSKHPNYKPKKTAKR